MEGFVAEYLRPWKLATFALGLVVLIVGADYYRVPDWDYPISFIMATMTYLTAPWSVEAVWQRKWKRMPLVLLWYYLTVDGSYWIYWRSVSPDALDLRAANFMTSSWLYWLCGFFWLHKGPLRTLIRTGDASPE